ncbi:hypothetical protein COY90_00620 [Candidatus Roizmanbacteria bacterium CG_4_10_14_0_8_um_filter_39_9]|uniref:endo-1,4-beta-xylanase n=1 Tax=Candidatus Roizmanbacteria bacterium CG_4_10_14_0_8_um_filter_39_9 TaxID=1974829 RepID=A0A2M7QDY6_9BACT|nr:MAG: hypothetical protein COY90_00620 [Candidatus Roizmanbacteria bacterium CG_4_10_14_0_8_um_filter_39_9]
MSSGERQKRSAQHGGIGMSRLPASFGPGRLHPRHPQLDVGLHPHWEKVKGKPTQITFGEYMQRYGMPGLILAFNTGFGPLSQLGQHGEVNGTDHISFVPPDIHVDMPHIGIDGPMLVAGRNTAIDLTVGALNPAFAAQLKLGLDNMGPAATSKTIDFFVGQVKAYEDKIDPSFTNTPSGVVAEAARLSGHDPRKIKGGMSEIALKGLARMAAQEKRNPGSVKLGDVVRYMFFITNDYVISRDGRTVTAVWEDNTTEETRTEIMSVEEAWKKIASLNTIGNWIDAITSSKKPGNNSVALAINDPAEPPPTVSAQEPPANGEPTVGSGNPPTEGVPPVAMPTATEASTTRQSPIEGLVYANVNGAIPANDYVAIVNGVTQTYPGFNELNQTTKCAIVGTNEIPVEQFLRQDNLQVLAATAAVVDQLFGLGQPAKGSTALREGMWKNQPIAEVAPFTYVRTGKNGEPEFGITLQPGNYGYGVVCEKNGVLMIGATDGNYKLATELKPLFLTPAEWVNNLFPGKENEAARKELMTVIKSLKMGADGRIHFLTEKGEEVAAAQWVGDKKTEIFILGLDGISGVPQMSEQMAQALSNDAEYLSAMGIKPEQVKMVYQSMKDVNGDPFMVAIDQTTGVPRAIGTQGTGGEWVWNSLLLDDAGQKAGLDMGAYFAENNPAVLKAIKENFNMGTIWVGMSYSQPERGKFDDTSLKYYGEIAKQNKIETMAMPLIWQEDVPKWITEGNFSKEELTEIMQTHIKTLMKKHPEITNWVVVNEPYAPPYITNDIFHKTISEDYIQLAFEAAREANPKAKLILNNSHNHTESGIMFERTLKLSKILAEKGLIDYVGVEMHIDGSKPPSEQELIKALSQYPVPIFVTELDVNMSNVSGSQKERMHKQAEIYMTIGRGIVQAGNVKKVNLWGINDNGSVWEAFRNQPNADPLLFDDNFNKKKAYYWFLRGIIEGLIGARYE